MDSQTQTRIDRDGMMDTPIQYLGDYENNRLWVKRDDLLPFSFGGNKARKAGLFFREIREGGYDCVVTYGTSSSNHCRVTSNLCASRGLPCFIISPAEKSGQTFNSILMELFQAQVTTAPIGEVHDAIEQKLEELRLAGHRPYFIEGGGHGNLGTQAYVQCFREIKWFEEAQGVHFDYIFLASGTGTTQAGLVCGNLLEQGNSRFCDAASPYGKTCGNLREQGGCRVVGISIARKNPRGRDVVVDSVKSYLAAINRDVPETAIQDEVVFVDDYTGGGYGFGNEGARDAVRDVIEKVLRGYGIPLDGTYTGKAFYGMTEYTERMHVRDKDVLFLHTGGTPLFFDALAKMW